MDPQKIAALSTAAAAAASAGRWAEAERLWTEVRALDPQHVQALYSLGVHAYQRSDLAGALQQLQAAQRAAPQDPMILLTLGVVHRDRGDTGQEWNCIIQALTIAPYFLPGLLGKGEYLQRQGQSRRAAAVFRDVLKVAPPEPQWPAALRQRLAQARELLHRDTEALSSYLNHQVATQRTAVDATQTARWDEAVSILAGKSRPYHSECNQLFVPRLPAQPFYERSLFDWVPALEARAAEIKAELQALVAGQLADFKPYVAYQPGDPVNQWQALNHSRDWSSYALWANGEPVQAHLDRCPRTAEALGGVGAVHITGLCPNAMFSALAPRTVIPPHTGDTNARLVAHLPLVVPEGCSFRVGHEWRPWREGEVMVFDDSIEHEARNDSDALRVVLIFDVWNPLLSQAEREMVNALSAAMRRYRALPD